MPRQSLETKVQQLEQHVTGLEELPSRMDRLESQFVRLRSEMRDECSAVRQDRRMGDERTIITLRDEILRATTGRSQRCATKSSQLISE